MFVLWYRLEAITFATEKFMWSLKLCAFFFLINVFVGYIMCCLEITSFALIRDFLHVKYVFCIVT